MFKVQKRMCSSCIYRPDSPLDLEKLERDVADRHGGFSGHRVCHHSNDVCCRGFWEAHKDKFPMGQIAQRLGAVEFVNVDTLATGGFNGVRLVSSVLDPDFADDDRRACPKCGGEMEWTDCWMIDCEDGMYDAYEEDPINNSPGDYEPCSNCGGHGGWLHCPSCEKPAEGGK